MHTAKTPIRLSRADVQSLLGGEIILLVLSCSYSYRTDTMIEINTNFERKIVNIFLTISFQGAQWLSGRALDSRPKGCGFEPHHVTAL